MISCFLLKISFVNPYLKIIDLLKHFVEDAPMMKTCFTPSQSTLKYGAKTPITKVFG